MPNVYFRYGSTSLDFSSGQLAPVFPYNSGIKLHTNITESIYYVTTSRYHATTELNLSTQSIKQTDRNTIYTFWNTTLSSGYHDFTFIDHRGRFLFETSWNDWNESWSKTRGGVHNIDYKLESGCQITKPCFGMYPLTSSDVDLDDYYFSNHNLNDTDTISLQDATFESTGTDANVLRLNGYALKLTGTAGVDVGAVGTVSFDRAQKYRNFTIFCQFRCPLSPFGAIILVRLNQGTPYFELRLENDGAKNGILGLSNINGAVERFEDTKQLINNDTWTDAAICYDDINKKVYIYSCDSGDTSFVNFLSGVSDIEDNYNTFTTTGILDRKFDTLTLLTETLAGSITNDTSVYMQNLMIFDGIISSIEFNTLRRLCYLWNKKTVEYPK